MQRKTGGICNYQDCTTQASFNCKGMIRWFCANHKTEGMCNVRDNYCQADGCESRAHFNYPGIKKGVFCEKHKLDTMVDTKHNMCEERGCEVRATFNHSGEKKGRFCFAHKEEGMIALGSKICNEPGCKISATFNFEGKVGSIKCFTHKLEGMISMITCFCQSNGCKRYARHNFEGQSGALYCHTHRLEGMKDIFSRRCGVDGCQTQPSFNYEGKKSGKFCKRHKEPGMVDVLCPVCKTPHCGVHVTRGKREGYCFRCYCFMFPDQPIARNYKTKENVVTTFVKNTFSDLKWVVDKTVDGGCSLRRPDLLCDQGSHVIIIEIDEDQHKKYDKSCVDKRTAEILDDLRTNIVFIRFNPDAYNSNEGKITSPWKTNHQGLYTIMKTRQKEWDQRLDTLKEMISKWINQIPDKIITEERLFYDED